MTESRSPQEATRGERFSWCLFDFANSAFNTIVVTFVFVNFFTGVLVGDQVRGDLYWSRSLTVAGLVIAFVSPILGSVADRGAHKKLFLVAFSLLTVVFTAGLFFVTAEPGSGRGTEVAVWTALVLFTAANVCFELMFVFYNAFLPGLAPADRLGRLSGYGWALGYVGGLLSIALCLMCIGVGDMAPWLPEEGHFNLRATNLIAAAWFLLFALPMFLLVRDRRVPGAAPSGPGSVAQVIRTLRSLPDYPDLFRLLIARMFYNDATIALIGLSALYMKGTLLMDQQSILLVAIWLNVAAGVGAAIFGFIDDWLGAKTVLMGSIALLLVGSVVAVLAPSMEVFVAAATLVGVGMGPNQASSRTMLARFVPATRSAEFYGLYALSGKATVWLGPLLFDIVRSATVDHEHSQRLAFLPIVGMFVIGGVLLWGVDERRGAARAQAMAPDPGGAA